MTTTTFEVEGSGFTVPALTVEGYQQVVSTAQERYGLQTLQLTENYGRAIVDLMARLGSGQIAGMRVLVLIGAYHGGLGAAVAARHLVNRGARVTVLLDRKPRDLPRGHHQLASMLAVLGLEIRVAEADDVELYLPEEAQFDRVIDGLGGYDAPPDLGGVRAALVAAARTAGVATIALDLPSGLDPDTGDAPGLSIEALATVAPAFPLRALALAPESVLGDVYLADLSIPAEVASDLGFPLAPVFSGGGLIKLGRLAEGPTATDTLPLDV